MVAISQPPTSSAAANPPSISSMTAASSAAPGETPNDPPNDLFTNVPSCTNAAISAGGKHPDELLHERRVNGGPPRNEGTDSDSNHTSSAATSTSSLPVRQRVRERIIRPVRIHEKITTIENFVDPDEIQELLLMAKNRWRPSTTARVRTETETEPNLETERTEDRRENSDVFSDEKTCKEQKTGVTTAENEPAQNEYAATVHASSPLPRLHRPSVLSSDDHDRFRQAKLGSPGDFNSNARSETRTSYSCVLGDHAGAVVRRIRARVAAVCGAESSDRGEGAVFFVIFFLSS